MAVQVRYFASLREALGSGEHFELPQPATLGALRDALAAQSPRHAEVLARGRAVRGAVNHTMGDDATPVPDGAEVAFFPPVTGG